MIWTWLAVLGALAGPPGPPSALDCGTMPCAEVLPGARVFREVEGRPYVAGFASEGAPEPVGWVALSTDIVDVKAYSGKPLVTLVGVDGGGVITGARVLHHSEPILLVGIPESALLDFVSRYAGRRSDARIVVGRAGPGEVSVDLISGATVTSLAQNRTILETARSVAEDVGAIESSVRVPGHFVDAGEPWSWDRMEREGALGRLTVTQEQMGLPPGPEPFLDMWFTVADAPQLGRALLGEHVYRHALAGLAPGEHLVVVLGRGTSSFKGSGFVRGGIFDRIRLEQGLSTVVFTDKDYTHLGRVELPGAPRFDETALFVARGRLDPGRTFDMVFLGSRFAGRRAFSREFHTFRASFRLPRSVYRLDGPDPEDQVWRQAWRNDRVEVALLAAWLAAIAGIFAGRRWATASMRRLKRLNLVALVVAFAGIGIGIGLQPSVTQLLTLAGSATRGGDPRLFLSDPLLFVSWIFIAVVTIAWGRGVFCGWVCPYGAMSELLFRLARRLRLPSFELPESAHRRLRLARYAVLLLLLVLYLADPATGERAAEVEPFKSTFYVAPWTRAWGYLGWWILLLLLSAVSWRPFCRYLCPLGAALALPSTFRLSGPRRRSFCGRCRICARGCEPRAIRRDGSIDPRECLSCMACEANYRDEHVCPPLVRARRDRERAAS